MSDLHVKVRPNALSPQKYWELTWKRKRANHLGSVLRECVLHARPMPPELKEELDSLVWSLRQEKSF